MTGAVMQAPVAADRRLVAIGLAAGMLSALMGVGGGIVVVPALTLVLGYPVKLAAGTSLLAIAMAAIAGAIGYTALGYVDLTTALLLGVPAAAGAVAGAWLQQRLSGTAVQLAFAGFLLLTAITLVVHP
jgi:uncharacterized membrane protein YfcA